MIKTTLEWYTLDEKLPFDGKILADYDNTDIICVLKAHLDDIMSFEFINQMDWIDGKVMMFTNGVYLDYTSDVKYWAYVPEIREG